MNEVCFLPIFIFTDEDLNSIIRILTEEGLYQQDKPNSLFIHNKSDLINEENPNLLFEKISGWIKETPSIYVLKEWENTISKAKRDLFFSFNQASSYWPCILKKAIEEDCTDPNIELGSFLSKNLIARMERTVYQEDILNPQDVVFDKDELRKVFEGEKFIKKELLPDHPFTGDIYKIDDKHYGINIRPACDTLRDDNPFLYLLLGKEIKDKNVKKYFNKNALIERLDHSLIPFVHNGNIFEFKFKELKIELWDNLKEKRIGRLLPPYITRLQQRYAFYFHREGLPGVPKECFAFEEAQIAEAINEEQENLKSQLLESELKIEVLQKKLMSQIKDYKITSYVKKRKPSKRKKKK